MCMQCSTKAVRAVKDILPGYILMRARQDDPIFGKWKKGELGLVQCNDPDFTWADTGVCPYDGLTDKQINNGSKALHDRYLKWEHALKEAEGRFVHDPFVGYQLVKACMKAGYRPKRDGYNVVYWFVNYCAKRIKNKRRISEKL